MSGFQIFLVNKLRKSFSGTDKEKEELRLKGKTNWVQWDIRIKMSLGMSACKELLRSVPMEKDNSPWSWKQVDEQTGKLPSAEFRSNIASAFYRLIDDGAKPPFTRNIYHALKKAYGSTDAHTSLHWVGNSLIVAVVKLTMLMHGSMRSELSTANVRLSG